MRRGALILVVSAPLLFACAPVTYDFDILGAPTDPVKLSADVDFCRTNTPLYHAHPTIGSVASAGISGGAGAISYWPINQAIPVLGAAGGAGNEAQKGFDLTGQVHRNVFHNCLVTLTNRDGSAVVADDRP